MRSNRTGTGFAAGFIGAFVLMAIMFVMQALKLSGPPGFVGIYRSVFGSGASLDYVMASILFAISGGIWGQYMPHW